MYFKAAQLSRALDLPFVQTIPPIYSDLDGVCAVMESVTGCPGLRDRMVRGLVAVHRYAQGTDVGTGIHAQRKAVANAFDGFVELLGLLQQAGFESLVPPTRPKLRQPHGPHGRCHPEPDRRVAMDSICGLGGCSLR